MNKCIFYKYINIFSLYEIIYSYFVNFELLHTFCSIMRMNMQISIIRMITKVGCKILNFIKQSPGERWFGVRNIVRKKKINENVIDTHI